ncbi:ROK family transcriptional regulator [Aureimonas sp. Leaf454]|uniref:ROK family transcriptional regulator n=1 Tax=Aureimonas sp. Leaf454 TaxID=1736381 RepID=UPI0006F91679|nr:ROK family transcriptional regulator [Aureimonas sp. Leaf454]KQT46294.1 ROK family transcriptional regulator [Aureimonas sp. Leaf454]
MKTGDPELMRVINRFHILDLIRRYGPISRVEISQRGELSSTTVSAITGALVEDGIIQPVPVGGIHEPARGRPRVMLELNARAARVVGLRIGPHQIAVAVTDFRGDVLAHLDLPIRVRRQSVATVADLAEDAVRRAVVDAGLTLKEIDSVCATMSGIVEYGMGRVRVSPIFAERDVAFGEALASRLAVPVVVESEANALALSEHWFGGSRDLGDLAVLSLEQSIGLGILHGGQVFRGVHGLSHDIGRMVVGTRPDGSLLRLVDVACEQAVLDGLAADPSVRDAAHAGLGLRHAVDRLARADAGVVDLVERAGRAVGIALANVVSLFSPPRVLLAGSLLHLGAPFTGAVARSFSETVAEPLGEVTEIVVDPPRDARRLGQGAAAIALCELYGSPWNTTGPARPA